jgi:hypothetical protein
MKSQNFTVTTTPSLLIAAAPSNRSIYIHVIGTGVVYLGGSDVTSANGLLTEKNAVPFSVELPANEPLWAVSAGTEEVRILRPSKDGN